MAIVTPPFVLQASAAHTAKLFRRALGGLIGAEGVAAFNTAGITTWPFGLSGDLAVSQRGAGANMSVDVARGGGYVLGDDATDQGYYFGYNDATTNLVISAADPSNPRIDLVIMRIKDAAEGGAAGDVVTLEVVTGTPAGSPSAPTLPASSLQLAQVAVGAGVTSITNANITDSRSMAQTSMFERRTPSIKVYRTAAQSISNTTATAISFPTGSATEAWDTDALHSLSSNPTRITIPNGLAGKWLVQGSIEWAGNATGYRWAQILLNASQVANVTMASTGAAPDTHQFISTILQLNAGDYVELYGTQSSGGPLNAAGPGEYGTWFAATRLG